MESNVGSKGFAIAVFGGELITVAFELRYMIIFSAVLILADLWWGHSDTMKRYHKAKEADDKVLMEKYRWHKSRALRRSANKCVDYITYLVCGTFVGLAITEPMGGFSHLYTAAIGLFIGCLAEVSSIIGHYFYVKFDIEVKMIDVFKALWRFIVKVFSFKSKQLGEALEELNKESK